MTEANEPINPTIWDDKHNPLFIRDNDGLTKREYFAVLAMQGLLALRGNLYAQQLAKDSVEMADELIKALNNGSK